MECRLGAAGFRVPDLANHRIRSIHEWPSASVCDCWPFRYDRTQSADHPESDYWGHQMTGITK